MKCDEWKGSGGRAARDGATLLAFGREGEREREARVCVVVRPWLSATPLPKWSWTVDPRGCEALSLHGVLQSYWGQRGGICTRVALVHTGTGVCVCMVRITHLESLPTYS